MICPSPTFSSSMNSDSVPVVEHVGAFAHEGCPQDHPSGRDLLRRFDPLLVVADEVVDVLQLAVLRVQRVTAEPGTV
jgi:hypothetical protein